MKVKSKRIAMQHLTASLFKPVNGHTLSIGKFDGGKYTWQGATENYEGCDVIDIPGVHAVWMERRLDSDGPYGQLMCVHED